MKLKITITGPKVQGVGYRPYLAELAMRLVLRGFEVYNDDGNTVITLLEGDEQRIKKFVDTATNNRPLLAMVDNVTSDEFTGEVMPLWQFASINTATQMNKAVPLLLAMKKNTDLLPQVAANTGSTYEEIKALREDIQPGLAVQFRQLQADIRAIKDRLGMP
jgi:acylphosphatase